MVDRETFSRWIDLLECYSTLAAEVGKVDEAAFLADSAVYDLAERYLHLSAEAAIDLANHWIAGVGLRTPETNRDTFAVVQEAGEIDGELAEKLCGCAGFRDVLVHEYLDMDHRASYRAIRDDLCDLEALRQWAVEKVAREDED